MNEQLNNGDTARTPGQAPQPMESPPAFQPQDKTGAYRPAPRPHFSSKSTPPQRDMSGRRVDVDDIRNFGTEIW